MKRLHMHSAESAIRLLIASSILIVTSATAIPQENTEATESTDTSENAGGSENTVVAENVADWAAVAEVLLPEPSPDSGNPELYEVVLTPAVFTRARMDLLDLRLFTTDEKPVPYSLRILTPKDVRESLSTEQFNESVTTDGTREISLDLGSTEFQHNEVLIETTGNEYRRRVQLEGSDDGANWRALTEGFVMNFSASANGGTFDNATDSPSNADNSSDKFEVTETGTTSGSAQAYRRSSLKYTDSRLRYLRVRVAPDEQAGSARSGKDEFSILTLNVLHTVRVPGELTTQNVPLGQRQPTRTYGVPASRWLLELGGDNVPVSELEIDVEDHEFARDIQLEAEYPSYPPGTRSFQIVSPNAGYTWQRRLSDPREPIVVQFSELQTRRLRLTVTDYQNTPLTIKSIRAKAATRKLIFPAPTPDTRLVKLYFGRESAEPVRYDFDRNLPAKPTPAPVVATLMESQDNPAFVPPPKPLTERLPWLVYVVLSAVTAVLGIIISNMARYAMSHIKTPATE